MGRQKPDGVPRDAVVSVRTKQDLRDRLEKAADLAGRSMAQEVERRLEQSLRDNPPGQVEWSHATWAHARIAALSITHLEQIAGQKWLESAPLRAAVKATVAEVFEVPVQGEGTAMTGQEKEEAARLTAIGTAQAKFLSFRIGQEDYEQAHADNFPGEFTSAACKRL